MTQARALIISAVIVAAAVILGGIAVHQRYAVAVSPGRIVRVDTWSGEMVVCEVTAEGQVGNCR